MPISTEALDEAVRRVLASPHIEIVRSGGEEGSEIGFIYVHKEPMRDIRAEYWRVLDDWTRSELE